MQTQDLLKQWLVDNNKFANPPKEHVSGNFNLVLTVSQSSYKTQSIVLNILGLKLTKIAKTIPNFYYNLHTK